MPKKITWICMIFILTGCAEFSSVTPPVGNKPMTNVSAETDVESKVLLITGMVTFGEQIKINDPAFRGEFNAIIGQGYRSALDLECHWVKPRGTIFDHEPISICRSEDGMWAVAPRIWSLTN